MFVNVKILALLLIIHWSTAEAQQDDRTVERLQKCFLDNLLPLLDTKNALRLYKSEQDFSISLIKKIYFASPAQKNIFFSPYGIHQALLLALFVSLGQTEHSIKEALHFPPGASKAKIIQAFKMENAFQKLRLVNSSSNYEFNVANRFFVRDDLPIRDCMKQLFEEEIHPTNFRDLNGAIELINRWVSDKTKNNINNFLTPQDIGTFDIKLILTNAAYFKGLWQSKFLPENTRKEVFYISSSKNALVRMMHQKGNFKYSVSERLGAHILQLPYKGNDISLLILLPPFVSPNGMESMLHNLNGEKLAELVEPGYMIERPVEISIPKFEVEQELNLVPILEAMGVGDLFKGTANLTGLTGQDDVKFTDAKHRAKVSVDENGTVAAAATALYGFRSSRPLEPVKFICNHPFLYFIYDSVSSSILFMGIFNSPPV